MTDLLQGGVNEYIHRVGRTARAGQQGEAWAFLLPTEIGWVNWAESGMAKSEGLTQSEPKLVETNVNDLLRAGFGGRDNGEYETRATDVQMAYERWVSSDEAVRANYSNLVPSSLKLCVQNARMARKAFSSHVRAYATHPSNEKRFFHVKSLHLGHLAKAFGLREGPAGIGEGAGFSAFQGAPYKSAPLNVLDGKKRKQAEVADISETSEAERDLRKPAIPRSGRALEGKGLYGPKQTTGSDFNVAGLDSLEATLNRKRKK